MEVKDKQQISSFKYYQLIFIVNECYILMLTVQPVECIFELIKGCIKFLQVLIFKIRVVAEVPLSAAVVEAEGVALPREVDPLGVSELVAHEVQVRISAQTDRQQPDHLVQRDAPVDDVVLGTEVAHVEVDFLAEEPHRDGLVAHDGLVVRLAVRHALLLVPPVLHRVRQVRHAPVLVLLLADHLYPQVRQKHVQTIVKADAAVFHFPAESGHAGDVFGDGDGVVLDLVDECVGEHEVDESVHVDLEAEVVGVVAGEGVADAVVLVEDGGDGVEAEAVEVVLVHVVREVREQEPLHLVLRVVEQHRVPLRVVALRACVRVLVVRAVELRDPVQHVRTRVRVDAVHYHDHARLVRAVHHVLHVVGRPGSRTRREEVCHVVSK